MARPKHHVHNLARAKRRHRCRQAVANAFKGSPIAARGQGTGVDPVLSTKASKRRQPHGIGAARVLREYVLAAEAADRSRRPWRLSVVVEPQRGATRLEAAPIEPEDATLASAFTRAEVRGAERGAELLKAQDMVSADRFAALIGATRETVHQKRRRGEVLGLEGAKRGVRFPVWQLTANNRLLPGLPQVFDKFDGEPWATYRFLVHTHPELKGSTALQALKAGRLAQVLDVADNIAGGVFA